MISSFPLCRGMVKSRKINTAPKWRKRKCPGFCLRVRTKQVMVWNCSVHDLEHTSRTFPGPSLTAIQFQLQLNFTASPWKQPTPDSLLSQRTSFFLFKFTVVLNSLSFPVNQESGNWMWWVSEERGWAQVESRFSGFDPESLLAFKPQTLTAFLIRTWVDTESDSGLRWRG